MLKCNPRLAKRQSKLCLATNRWKDLTQEDAAQRVIDGESLLCLGVAGTGKTHFLSGIVEQLRAQGKRVDIISKTHMASRRPGGVTADHYVRKHILHGCCTADYVWVDEISQIDIGILAQLNKLTFSKVKWLLSGDFNQFPPLFNNWKGSPIEEDAFEKKQFAT